MMTPLQNLLGDREMTMSYLGLSFLIFQSIFNSLYLHLLLPQPQNVGKLLFYMKVQVSLPKVVHLVVTHHNNN